MQYRIPHPVINPAPRKVGRPPHASTLFKRILSAGRPSRARLLVALARLAEQADAAASNSVGEARLLRDIARALSRAPHLAHKAVKRRSRRG